MNSFQHFALMTQHSNKSIRPGHLRQSSHCRLLSSRAHQETTRRTGDGKITYGIPQKYFRSVPLISRATLVQQSGECIFWLLRRGFDWSLRSHYTIKCPPRGYIRLAFKSSKPPPILSCLQTSKCRQYRKIARFLSNSGNLYNLTHWFFQPNNADNICFDVPVLTFPDDTVRQSSSLTTTNKKYWWHTKCFSADEQIYIHPTMGGYC